MSDINSSEKFFLARASVFRMNFFFYSIKIPTIPQALVFLPYCISLSPAVN